jgi:electron transfer flavoprotein beta subunit
VKILVCIKQVPGTNRVEIDEETGSLKRTGVESKMNPFDLFAIETAIRIRDKTGGSVSVLTMGPPQAHAVIREAFMMGADDGCIMSDPAFAGADVLATSYTLSQGIKVMGGFDLVICGKQTTDGDTAQVGPSIAEYLDIPHVAWVSRINEVDYRSVSVDYEINDSIHTVKMDLPCLITVEKDIMQPRLPSYRKKLATRDREIRILGLNDLFDNDPDKYGASGSATRVERIFAPEANLDRVILEGTGKELTDKLYDILRCQKFLPEDKVWE